MGGSRTGSRSGSRTGSRTVFTCRLCAQQLGKWAGRCPGCGEWGTVDAATVGHTQQGAASVVLGGAAEPEARIPTGVAGVDRVLGGGIVPGSVVLLAGEPGIGKSTLLLHLVGRLAATGRACMVASGEESRTQVAARARRIGVDGAALGFTQGRDLGELLGTVGSERPFLVAVDSIQTLRDPSGSQTPGGVAQVRTCTDALVGLAKAHGVTVLLAGHVTKDGDLAGPRALEHAVDVVLTFEGDPRSGLRVLAGGKNRFGAEGESAWFEMGAAGLTEIDPTQLLVPGELIPGAAVALPRAGRRALAVEVQALVGAPDGAARRQATGLDPRRFQLICAVLERALGLPLGRADVFGATAGGLRVDDPACDLAVAVALASAATGALPPPGSAFIGELSLTGLVRPAPALEQRLLAARAAGCRTVFVPEERARPPVGVRVVTVRDLADVLGRALSPAEMEPVRLPA